MFVGLQRGRVVAERGSEAFELALVHVALDVADLPVDAFLSTDRVDERQCPHLGVPAEPPGIDLGAGELGAVDAGLLPGADADDHPGSRVRNGVRLGVPGGDHRKHQIRNGRVR